MTLLQNYEQLRGKIYARRERMLLEREAGQHFSVFFGALWLAVMELRSVFLRFLILNFSDPTESFKILLRLKPEDVCTYSYCSYRYFKNRVKLFSLAGTSLIIIGSVVGTFLLSIILPLLALRAQTVNWQTRPDGATLKKENLFTAGDWPRGHLLGTTVIDNELQLAQGQNQGSGADQNLEIDQLIPIERLTADDGSCAGRPVAARFDIFDFEEQAVTLRDTLGETDCLNVGDEVAIMYFSGTSEARASLGYDLNYVQGIRGRRILLAAKFVAKPANFAVLARIPQFENLIVSRHGALTGELAMVRAKMILSQSNKPIINLAAGTENLDHGAWLSPFYTINTINSFAEKIAWEGTSALPSDVRLVVGSGNNKNSLQWDSEEMVGCTTRTPCKIAPRHFNKKYIQAKLILSNGGGPSPQIKNLSVISNIGQASEPTLVGPLDYRLLGMRVLSPDAPDVLVQVRAGKTLADLKKADWCGYNTCGTGDFFTTENIKKTVSADHQLNQNGHRWFQYRIFSANTDEQLSQKLVRAIKLRLQSVPRAVGKL